MGNVVITRGMANHLLGRADIKLVCPCGYRLPKYRGRYPVKCPSCGNSLFTIQPEQKVSYYESLYETFLSQQPQIRVENKLEPSRVRGDLLRFSAMPFLLSLQETCPQKIPEILYYLNFPMEQSVGKDHHLLYETALRTYRSNADWAYLGGKIVGVHPDLIASKKVVEKVRHTARKLISGKPAWVRPQMSAKIMTEARQTEILAEHYGYARQYLEHDEAVFFANMALLHESLWLSHIPPSSVLVPRLPGDYRRSIGGFRFTVQSPVERLQFLRYKIMSRKNRGGGLASRVSSMRQTLQRRQAQKKATLWHKLSPAAVRMHKGLGSLLHRAHGSYQPTREGYSQMRHLKISESALRLFSDGKPYHQGSVCYFSLEKSRVFESQVRIGGEYTLRGPMTSTIYLAGGVSTRLEPGTQIRVESMTPAEKWRGDYPNTPMGQWVVEVVVLDGPEQGSYLEFDGADIVDGLGIDEGAFVGYEVKPSRVPHGAIYIDERELVVSVYDHLLNEAQIGALLRKLRPRMFLKDTVVRVYNDAPAYESLRGEIRLSLLLEKKRVMSAIGGKILLFEEKDEERQRVLDDFAERKKQLRMEIAQKMRDARAENAKNKEDQLEQLRMRLARDMENLENERKRELEGIKESEGLVYAGGEGEILQEPLTVIMPDGESETGSTRTTLAPGTRVTRESDGMVLVLSGPYHGKVMRVANGPMPDFTPNLEVIETFYRGML